MIRLHVVSPRQASAFVAVVVTALLLSACSDVTGQVQDTLSGALAPVNAAVNDVSRRANDVGEGINQVTTGVSRVRGALSGSGSHW